MWPQFSFVRAGEISFEGNAFSTIFFPLITMNVLMANDYCNSKYLEIYKRFLLFWANISQCTSQFMGTNEGFPVCAKFLCSFSFNLLCTLSIVINKLDISSLSSCRGNPICDSDLNETQTYGSTSYSKVFPNDVLKIERNRKQHIWIWSTDLNFKLKQIT